MEEAQLIVQGKVQGVFFRSHAQRAAKLLGISGYARNLETGDVEVVAQGSRSAIDELIERCYQGPPGASVQSIQVHWRTPREILKKFETR